MNEAQHIGSEPMTAGASINKTAPPTRLQATLTSVADARQRVMDLTARLAEVNKQLTGCEGPPSEDVGEKALARSDGVVGYLEQGVDELHQALSELERLVKYQRDVGIVA